MKKIYIAVFIILLIILTIIILLISLLSKKKGSGQEVNTVQAPIMEYDYGSRQIAPTLTQAAIMNITPTIMITPELRSNSSPTIQTPLNTTSITSTQPQNNNPPDFSEIMKNVSVLNNTEINKLDALKKNAPYENSDFSVDYSPLLNKFIIATKTNEAPDKIKKWLGENGLSQLMEKGNVFTITDQPIQNFKDSQEKIYQDNQDKIIEDQQKKLNEQISGIMLTPYINPPATSTTGGNNQNLNDIFNQVSDVLKMIFNEETLKGFQTTPSPGAGGTGGGDTSSNISSSLNEIFREVSQKVGIPQRVLEAVLKIESPSTLSLSANEIKIYSTPGNIIPGCGPNLCSAAGPMQMTIGIDNNGNTTCPDCGAGYCPNAWSSYGRSVNTYGQYSHTSNACNIKDSIYAAALKLKSDSGANDPNNWTQDQVYRAAKSYYGSCNDNYRYARLGNRTYCEYVWWYYTTQVSNVSNGASQSVITWAERINNNLEQGPVDPGFYNKLVNLPENNGYRATYREGRDSGVGPSGTYWCTNSIIDAYNLLGIQGLGIQHQSVVSMRSFWMNNSNYKYKPYSDSDKAKTISEIQPGCAVFFEKTPGVMTGYEHVAIVKAISLDSNFSGTMETYDSNSVVKVTRYPVYSGDVKNTPLRETLVGFGCL